MFILPHQLRIFSIHLREPFILANPTKHFTQYKPSHSSTTYFASSLAFTPCPYHCRFPTHHSDPYYTTFCALSGRDVHQCPPVDEENSTQISHQGKGSSWWKVCMEPSSSTKEIPGKPPGQMPTTTPTTQNSRSHCFATATSLPSVNSIVPPRATPHRDACDKTLLRPSSPFLNRVPLRLLLETVSPPPTLSHESVVNDGQAGKTDLGGNAGGNGRVGDVVP